MQSTKVKICGLSEPITLQTAIDARADFLGFIFFPPSPRHLTIEKAKSLTAMVPTHIPKVAVLVDPTNDDLDQIVHEVGFTMLQLHGKESISRVTEIRDRYHLPIIKAFPVWTKEDVHAYQPYRDVIDYVMFDAKPPKDAKLPGGLGIAFDWTLLQDHAIEKPWFLSGGLTPHNVASAIALTHPTVVDVSSGVESSPGIKDQALIQAFIDAVKGI